MKNEVVLPLPIIRLMMTDKAGSFRIRGWMDSDVMKRKNVEIMISKKREVSQLEHHFLKAVVC